MPATTRGMTSESETNNEETVEVKQGETPVKQDEEEDDDNKSTSGDTDHKEDEDKPSKKEEKKDTTNWPLKEIKVPHENDVLYGRGGGTNHHPGNKRYRKIVEGRKLDYVNSKRLDKPLVALEIIREWRGQDPPGRFLKLDESTGMWQDVGDKKAREKTSQALREKAPMIRKQQEEEDTTEPELKKEATSGATKNTRFEAGDHPEQKSGPKRAVLARDHSLGREYITPGEDVAIGDFSWEEPLANVRNPSGGWAQGPTTSTSGPPGPPPPQDYPPSLPSQGSIPPTPEGSYGFPSTSSTGGAGEDMRQRYSQNRYDSWGRINSQGSGIGDVAPPPPMPGYGAPGQYSSYERSGSYSQPPGSGPYTELQREHSLSMNPLRNASTGAAASPNYFGSEREGSGYWQQGASPSGPPGQSMGPPPPGPPPPGPPPAGYGPPTSSGTYPPPPSPYNSNGPPPQSYAHGPSSPSYTNPHTPNGSHRVASSSKKSPTYAMDPNIAKTWSAGSEDYEKAADMFQQESLARPELDIPKDDWSQPAIHSDSRSGNSSVPRPDIVKRQTSHQNENIETKKDLVGPSVKRAALNRDNSAATNRLKAQYLPPVDRGNFNADQEVKRMTSATELINLDCQQDGVKSSPMPKPLSDKDRTTTIDKIAMELMAKPPPIAGSNRTSTVDALLDFDSYDPLIAKSDFSRGERNSSGTSIGLGSIDGPLDMNRAASISEWVKDV
mmetsp:Transcript_5721/g.8821  ORF Transcript_5721/g.8821 Transcript_5721/m.8821 type:complete len:724 (+) Transcript_5721:272-2443(+)|eukprot:CAMPEP_0195290314 /NCGR_PEP_ID=MMETSP0707-20130614/6229_1 /TAXON_ID=33640 /ORGANISM="Asterionellopsis glacialis, Strain CCMP134" /LENGTH=723 /DNA_ID=CAMNT_0040350427 /DNA_START=205 /DNA_END=2376 /DNA_ORIENTATION=-